MKTILATAYAINPYKGSEDAMGWNFILQIARYQNVIAITRENNRPHIEKFIAENPNEIYSRISFYYFDLPKYLRFWKKGSRGALLYFWLWQLSIVRFIKKQKLDFDIAHNVNFHNDWTPSYLWKLKKPFVWGPIGHHPYISSFFLKNFSWSAKLKNKATWFIKKFFWKASFGLKRTISKSDHIFAMNSSVKNVIQLKHKNWSIMPSAATEDFCSDWKFQPKERFTIISVGRFVPLKGFDLSIDSFAKFCQTLSKEELDKCELICVGTGSDENLLREKTKKSGFEKHIRFINWMPRIEVIKMYQDASLFLFPSHEGAGMVVPEALSFGLPVVCLKNSGPGEFIDQECGIKVEMISYNQVVQDLANGLSYIFHDSAVFKKMSLAARTHFLKKFTWDQKGEQLHSVYQSLIY
jgi:glycosyltransferase involved in cell wall biosynthesis